MRASFERGNEEIRIMAELSPILCGVAGEYFVAAELSRRGYIASITLRNTRGIDILASNEAASRQVGIQVKANRGSARAWILHAKAETYYAENLYYVFVNLNLDRQDAHPAFYIVPSQVVAAHIRVGHHKWLVTPGKRGQIHKDGSIRKFQDSEGTYRGRWDLLGL